MHYGFNNRFIKVMKTWPKLQKHQNTNLFIFNIKDCELICKLYSQYEKQMQEICFGSRMTRFNP
jgi:hypothetical protein